MRSTNFCSCRETKRLTLFLQAFVLAVWCPWDALAEEPARAFLDGLRARGYHDTALDYLKSIKSSPLAPQELKETITYETALILVESSRKERDFQIRFESLERAQRMLKKFVSSKANHPKSHAAQSQLGNLMVERARIKVEQSKRGNPKKLLAEARKLYDQSFGEFTALEKKVSSELESIPKVLDLGDRKEALLAERRKQLRADNLQTELLAAAIREETADTVPEGTKIHTKYLVEAANLYDTIYKKYRSRLAGLYARMYQGRCNQRLGKTKDALGHYGELLDQPDQPEEFRVLKTKTLRLAMECWLAPSENKYREAIKRSTEWIATVPRSSEREQDMLAIRLSLARAYRMQAEDLRTREPRDDRMISQSIERARKQAFFVAGEAGEFKETAREMLVSLGGRNEEEKDQESETFDDAQRAGKKALDGIAPASAKITKIRRKVRQLKGAEKIAAQQELVDAMALRTEQQNKAVASYRLALVLADENTPPSEVNLVRYFLCYLYFLNEQYYEAAIIGDLVANRYPESAGARQCAKIALASYMRILAANEAESGRSGNDATENEHWKLDSDFEIARVVGVASHISDTWPGGPEAIEAATSVVPLLVNEGQLERARKMTMRIPDSSPQRGKAEFVTGQGMWGKHLTLTQKIQKWKREGIPKEVDLLAEQARRDKFAQGAQKLLAAGVRRLPSAPEVNVTNATALLSLAQAYVGANRFSDAVDVLEHETLGPVNLVAAKDDAVSSPVFVEETHRTALQAYVGLIGSGGDETMQKARAEMAALQTAVGADAAGKQRMLGVYVNLAKSVETQMMSADSAAKQQMSQVFEAFLQELSRGSSDIGVLNWVAETFASLGSGFDDDETNLNENAKRYFERSEAAFANILAMSSLDPQLRTQVQVRSASVKGKLRDFQSAMEQFVDVLKANPKAINVQVEAARMLQEWGETEPQRFDLAIRGTTQEDPPGDIWGWGKIATTTLQYAQFRDSFYEARYEMARCQYRLALARPSEKNKLIRSAKRMLTQTKALYPSLGGEKWTDLYAELLAKVNATK